jgi:phospholipid/cholesterol/gamma-HCH transport system substrate-binding protein
MARKTSKFMIGLFVTIGASIGLIAVIWLGAFKYFEKGATYVTFFNESVQGLQVDSAVKYRGVEVGRVEKIRVAPDSRLIEVVMKINLRGELEREYVAQLKAVGITGIVFIELDRKEPDEPDLSPQVTFASEYPIVASKPSDIAQIVSSVQEILEAIKKIDTAGISDQVKSTLTAVEATVNNLNLVVGTVEKALAKGRLEDLLIEVNTTLGKIQHLVSNAENELQALNLPKTGAHLEMTTARIEKIVSSGEIEKILTEANQTVVNLKQVMEALNRTMEGWDRMIEGLDQRSVGVTNDIKVTSENLKRASESLEMLVERVSASPSDLLFSQPPPPRREK